MPINSRRKWRSGLGGQPRLQRSQLAALANQLVHCIHYLAIAGAPIGPQKITVSRSDLSYLFESPRGVAEGACEIEKVEMKNVF